MSYRKRTIYIYGLLVLIAASLAAPVFAADFNCSGPHDPVTRRICAHPKILKLETQLSIAYAAALARDGAHANALRQDELDWLGQRDRQMSWLETIRREFPSLPSDKDSVLAHFYEMRIAFLRNIDNPAATHSAPIARRLLKSIAALPRSATDPLAALQSAGIVVLAKRHYAANVEHTIAALAAPPDAALRADLNRFQSFPFTVEYLPSVGLGGAFNVEGTAECQSWVLFEKKGNVSVPIDGAATTDFLGSLGGCMRDGGSTGYLALIYGRAVALNVTNAPYFSNVTNFRWQQWLGKYKWGPQREIQLRYGYRLRLDKTVYCPSAKAQCRLTRDAAMAAAMRYMRNAIALAYSMDDSAAERTRFEEMLRTAPNRKSWANCMFPVWFPAHLHGELVVGGVTESHLACHPIGGSLDVGFWGLRSNGRKWWFADDTVYVDRDGLLAASVVPPDTRQR